jgi:DNA polymerase III delta prime subunit
MSFGALTYSGIRPRPAFRKKLWGYATNEAERRLYLGITHEHQPIYILLPHDTSFLVKILLEGPSGVGKSITVRNLIEELYKEWKKSKGQIRHPIFIFDWKGNYLGFDEPNYKERDTDLLKRFHGITKRIAIPKQFINVYCPAYVAPVTNQKLKKEILEQQNKKWAIKDFWGVPWRQIIDLAHLGKVLKVPAEALWAEELRAPFERAAIDPKMTLKELIGTRGFLVKAAKAIRNPQSRAAALDFVQRWRKNRWWFSNECLLAQHLYDSFSVNVLTFVEVAEKIYFNQLAFLIALESIMTSLQELKIECQPVIVIHDILNWIGEGKPFRNEIIDSLVRLFTGQARSLVHGYILIIETQSLEKMPKPLNNPKEYIISIRLKWKSQSPSLKPIPGFIGGCGDFHDNYRNFHMKSVIIRPPLTNYQT